MTVGKQIWSGASKYYLLFVEHLSETRITHLQYCSGFFSNPNLYISTGYTVSTG